MGKGQNYKNQNFKKQKDHHNCIKASEYSFKWSECQKWERSEQQKSLIRMSIIRTSKRTLKVKNTFDILIIQNATVNIRTSKVLVPFLLKNLFDILIVPMMSEKIRTSKVTKIDFKSLPMMYYLWIPRPVGG
jgi:hypothetical protein